MTHTDAARRLIEALDEYRRASTGGWVTHNEILTRRMSADLPGIRAMCEAVIGLPESVWRLRGDVMLDPATRLARIDAALEESRIDTEQLIDRVLDAISALPPCHPDHDTRTCQVHRTRVENILRYELLGDEDGD